MLFKPELGNKEDVLKWYDTRGNNCYLLFTGVKCDARQLLSKHLKDENGTENLETVLSFISNNNSNTNVYTIISVPYFDGIETKRVGDLEGETIRFQFNNSYYSSGGKETFTKEIINNVQSGNDGYKVMVEMLHKQNQQLMERLDNMQQKLLEREEDEEEEDEEPEELTGKEKLMGAIGGLIEKPQVADLIGAIGAVLIQKFMGNGNNGNTTEGNREGATN